MENINSGEQNTHNFIESISFNENDGNHQPQDTMMSDFTSNIQVGQISAERQNQRMYIMSRQRRGYPATQCRPSYRTGNSSFSSSNTISNQDHTSCVGVTMIRQICQTEPIPYHALTSNFEHGNSSRYQQPTSYDYQDVASPTH